MTSTTLKFKTLGQLVDFIKASFVRNYELNATTNTLIASLSEVQIKLAINYEGAVVGMTV